VPTAVYGVPIVIVVGDPRGRLGLAVPELIEASSRPKLMCAVTVGAGPQIDPQGLAVVTPWLRRGQKMSGIMRKGEHAPDGSYASDLLTDAVRQQPAASEINLIRLIICSARGGPPGLRSPGRSVRR
jgi:hypothetical protein